MDQRGLRVDMPPVRLEAYLCLHRNRTEEAWLWFLMGSLPPAPAQLWSFQISLSESVAGPQILTNRVVSLVVISTSLDKDGIGYQGRGRGVERTQLFQLDMRGLPGCLLDIGF